ncbi:L,D-transpeptidase family protein [Aliirhizobium smilacinae]|uniref:L,D-transpeptidase n=1 Tax=Aliirhizobium smilacinae TaxID=1395944 RepID=A0A5C4XEN2_9HYPH|nr:L,D-transpeptidase [Rhizobium smilacinae]TNM61020.1 L,D-transpeptidase [Rhizobium smilacinae]
MPLFRVQNPKKQSIITVRTAPRSRQRAIVSFKGITFQAAIGRSGVSAFKREGDGATPIASMRLLNGFVRGERIRLPQTPLSMRRIGRDMLWCDEPKHAAYNRLVKSPFRPSHEEMMRADGLYDVCLVLDWNITSRKRHGGSAIFFHLIKPGYQPTAGCIAVSPRDMKRLLPHLRKGTMVKVVG